MRRELSGVRYLMLSCAALGFGLIGTAAAEPGRVLVGVAASGHEQSDGSMSSLARAARDDGALHAGPADVAAKAAADRAYDQATSRSVAPSAADLAASGSAAPTRESPIITGG